MKVKRLKELIAGLPDDMEIILQRDSEGNSYSPLACADSNAVYVPENTYSGEVYSLTSNAEDTCMEEEEWEKVKAMPRCLVLAPKN